MEGHARKADTPDIVPTTTSRFHRVGLAKCGSGPTAMLARVAPVFGSIA
jgi:hypothetical protein